MKVRTILSAGLGVLLFAAALVCLYRPSRLRVKVLDPNFRVLGVKVLHGAGDSFYLGNQTEGRLRDYLAQRLHLNVKGLPEIGKVAYGSTSYSTPRGGPLPPHRCVLVISYSLAGVQNPIPIPPAQLTPAFFAPLYAEFRDSSGAFIPVDRGFYGGSKPYWLSFNLDFARTNAGNYKLRLMHAGACVAEVEINDLPAVSHKPYHVGPNAF